MPLRSMFAALGLLVLIGNTGHAAETSSTVIWFGPSERVLHGALLIESGDVMGGMQVLGEALETKLNFADYLLNNTHVRSYYGTEAADVLKEMYLWIKSNQTKKNKKYAVDAVSQFHSLLLKIRRRGVAMDYWEDWIEMQEWLQLEKKNETKETQNRKGF